MNKAFFLLILSFTFAEQFPNAWAATKTATTTSSQNQAMVAKLLLGNSNPSTTNPTTSTSASASGVSCLSVINSNPQIQQKLQTLGTSFVNSLSAANNGDPAQMKAALAGYQANPTSLLQSLNADQQQIVSQIAQMVNAIAPNCH